MLCKSLVNKISPKSMEIMVNMKKQLLRKDTCQSLSSFESVCGKSVEKELGESDFFWLAISFV